MKNYILLLTIIFTLASCKSTKNVLTEGTADSDLAAAKIIKGHYANAKDFSTAYIKSAARYKDDKQTHNVTAEIRIKKDEKILVSIRFLGITMAKALITPTEVKYYEKINNEYFEGNYKTLSSWLGTDLDFQKVQNMFIGRAMDDLTKDRYTSEIEGKFYKLISGNSQNTRKAFFFEGENFLIKKQEIDQPALDRNLTVTYPAYTENSGVVFPAELLIVATQKKGKNNITIKYDSVTFNEELSFPYSVPEGYDRVFID